MWYASLGFRMIKGAEVVIHWLYKKSPGASTPGLFCAVHSGAI